MSSPLRILFDQPAGRRGMVVPVLSAVLRSVGIVLLAEAVVRAIVGSGDPVLWFSLALLGAGLRGASLWCDHSWGTRTAALTDRRLRSAILSTLLSGRSRPRASTAVTVTRGVDDLEDYFTTVVPALSAAAVVPATLLTRIVFADLLSAVIIVVCLPLVPVFMILIGRFTADSTAATNTALARMSDHLAELAAGLPVFIGVGRSRDHARSLRRLGRDYHEASLTTLRVAFLSSLALELIATISVALVAVVIGLRLVSGSMDLATGLFVLLLAPECFIPLRQLGAGYHASENGRDAYDRARALLTEEEERPEAETAPPAHEGTHLVRYADGTRISWAGEIPRSPGITAITGATGAGKSSVLAALTGTLPATAESTLPVRDCAYVPQTPRMFAETIGEELRVFGLPGSLREALRAAALPTEPTTPTAALSPGQLRRLALVRIEGRIGSGAEVLVLDEPTAHLDDDNARAIIEMIRALSGRIRVVLASHDAQVLALAENEIRPRRSDRPCSTTTRDGGERPSALRAQALLPSAQRPEAPAGGAPAADPPAAGGPIDGAAGESGGGSPSPIAVVGGSSTPAAAGSGSWRRRWATLRATMPLLSRDMVLALLASCAAGLAAIALTAVSAWLIVEASYQPPIMTLMVAIVGVRFFGLSRSLLQYLSRLRLHSAIFASLTRLRSNLWTHFERAGMSDRKMLTSATALRTVVSDADDVRDRIPRTLVPPVVSGLVFASILLAAGLLHPVALPILIALGVLDLVVVPALLLRAQNAVEPMVAVSRERILSRITRALAAKVDLTANRAAKAVLAGLAETETELAAAQRRSAAAFGAAQLAIQLSTAAAAVAVAATTTAPTEIMAVAVLMTLGLSDVFAGGLAAWRELPGLGLVLDRIPAPDSREVPAAPDSREAAAGHAPRPPGHQPRSADREPGPGDRRDAGRPLGARAPRLDSLRLEGISVGWGREPVLTDLDLHADRRHWTVVVGDSGSGKSTTLSVLLRFLDPWAGTYLATTPAGDSVDVLGFDPAALAGRVAWCPQEAHVFRSTVRGNLAIARAVAPSETEMCTALERAGLAEWADRDGLDRWVGDHGADISGGQRQRLAVARTILSGADVIVLDEPTAHLDRDTAQSLLTHLRESLADHTVVLVTHDRGLIEADDRVIDLGSRRLSPVSSRT